MHRTHTLILGYAAAVGLMAFSIAGCAAGDSDSLWPPPRALGQDLPAAGSDSAPPAAAVTAEPDGPLTLRGALALALARNPALTATSWTVRAAEANALQQGLAPNPELRIQLDDFGGTGQFEGTGRSDQEIRLSQVIELGGKAARRRRAARMEAALCGWDYEAARLDVFTETTKAFVSVLAAQQRVAAAQEMHDLAEQVLAMLSKGAPGGVEGHLAAEEAKIELGVSRIELERANHALVAARGVLAGYWDQTTPTFGEAVGDLANLSPTSIPTCEQLLTRIRSNPDIGRWDAETRMRQAVLEREKADGISDVRVLVGARRLEETGDYGYSSALEISLPLFDRNQGSIREAKAEVTRAGYERQAAIMEVAADVREAHQSLSVSRREASLLTDEVIPAAQAALDITDKAIEWGGAATMQTMKARRELFEAQIRKLDALEVYHRSLADLERLIGEPIGDLEPLEQAGIPSASEPAATTDGP